MKFVIVNEAGQYAATCARGWTTFLNRALQLDPEQVPDALQHWPDSYALRLPAKDTPALRAA